MRRMIYAVCVLCTMLFFVVQASSAQAAGYVTAPFTVNGADGLGYLGRAIPSMLSSRLYWEGNMEPVQHASVEELAPLSGHSAAQHLLQKVAADYVIWGDINVVGDTAAVTVYATGKGNSQWQKSTQTSVNSLVPALQTMADTISAEVFGRPMPQGGTTGSAQNTALLSNQSSQQQVYLNPQIRYQGSEGSRLRSPSFSFASAGMEIADFNGDKRNEIALLDDDKVLIYLWDEQFTKIAEFTWGPGLDPVAVRSMDLDRDGKHELLISTYDENLTIPYTYTLTMNGNQLTEMLPRQRLFVNVVRMQPDFVPVLLGQRGDPSNIFSHNGVYELLRQGNEYVFGRKVSLPSWGNLYNFAWLPGEDGAESDRFVMLTPDEELRVFDTSLHALYTTTNEMFSGSTVGLTLRSDLPGTGRSSEAEDFGLSKYYIPLRMMITDFDDNKKWELLVNSPSSLAAEFFGRFRNFPECDIQALSWDGIGLNLLWKTRRIKGSVADFTVVDANNDGMLDLVANINSYAGALGLTKVRTTVVAYPLNLNQMNPNTPPVTE